MLACFHCHPPRPFSRTAKAFFVVFPSSVLSSFPPASFLGLCRLLFRLSPHPLLLCCDYHTRRQSSHPQLSHRPRMRQHLTGGATSQTTPFAVVPPSTCSIPVLLEASCKTFPLPCPPFLAGISSFLFPNPLNSSPLPKEDDGKEEKERRLPPTFYSAGSTALYYTTTVPSFPASPPPPFPAICHRPSLHFLPSSPSFPSSFLHRPSFLPFPRGPQLPPPLSFLHHRWDRQEKLQVGDRNQESRRKREEGRGKSSSALSEKQPCPSRCTTCVIVVIPDLIIVCLPPYYFLSLTVVLYFSSRIYMQTCRTSFSGYVPYCCTLSGPVSTERFRVFFFCAPVVSSKYNLVQYSIANIVANTVFSCCLGVCKIAKNVGSENRTIILQKDTATTAGLPLFKMSGITRALHKIGQPCNWENGCIFGKVFSKSVCELNAKLFVSKA